MGKLTIVEHPLVQHKITMLRNETTGPKEFRELADEVATLICYEAMRDVELANIETTTPLETTTSKTITGKFAIVPILRAGVGMADGILRLIPTAKVGHIGLYRDPDTLLPIEYYCKLPSDIAERTIFVLDPMLATGGTASAAIEFLKDKGAKDVKLFSLITCTQGVSRIAKDHPDVDIYSAAHDGQLNASGYIVPGLGDVGDRMFGTK